MVDKDLIFICNIDGSDLYKYLNEVGGYTYIWDGIGGGYRCHDTALGSIQLLEAIINDAKPQPQLSPLTNSPSGSYHWYHTIMAQHLHIGEFLANKSPTEEVIRAWGSYLYKSSKELVDHFEKINKPDIYE